MVKPVRCMIVDDESPARDILRQYIALVPSLELVAESHHAMDALQQLHACHVQLLFLDIEMPALKGTDMVKALPQAPWVIFITAHRDFALEGFELNAVDYLLKPVSFERFLRAVNKVYQLRGDPATPLPAADSAVVQPAFLYFRVDRKMVKVLLDDILYVESLKDYVRIVTRDKPVVTKLSISSLETMLPSDRFIRIHRSYIVARTVVNAYTAEWVELERQQLPIGRLYRQEVLKRLC